MTAAPWSAREGFAPHAVVVEERADRGLRLQLRWWQADAGRWRTKALKATLADKAAEFLADAKRERRRLSDKQAREAAEGWAKGEARVQYERLAGKRPSEDAPASVVVKPLTILEGLALAFDAEHGHYPADTAYARTVHVAVKQAATVWGNGAWNAVDLEAWERFWRARIRAVRLDGGEGLRAATAAVERVHGVARWLRDRRRIDLTAAILPSDWRDAITRDWAKLAGGDAGAAEVPDAHRPRYTLDETRRLFAAAADVDPRLSLLFALGAGLRAGQVLRAERHDLTLDGPDAGAHGTFRVRGRGNKQGATVELTRGERATVDHALGHADPAAGYLRSYEQNYRGGGATYPLFPGGALTRRTGWRPVSGSAEVSPLAPATPRGTLSHRTAVTLLRACEVAAGVAYAEGRSFHGLRRAFVDGASDPTLPPDQRLSNEALMQLGGWSDERTPKRIYRDRELVQGRGEARDARARLRGEDA